MSDRKPHEEEPKKQQPDDDDFEDAIVAADDTGMVRNEMEIVEVETEEGLEP